MSAVITSQARLKTRTGAMQTKYGVLCECGYQNSFWAQSWAGNGFAKCKGCGAKIYKSQTVQRANTACSRRGVGSALPDVVEEDGTKIWFAKPRPRG